MVRDTRPEHSERSSIYRLGYTHHTMTAVSWLRPVFVVTAAWPFLMAAAALTALVSLLPLAVAVGYAVVKLAPIRPCSSCCDELVRQSWKEIRTVILLELALVVCFTAPRGEFILVGVADSRRTEFIAGTHDTGARIGPLLGASQDVARRFAYATMANKRDVMASLEAPTLDVGRIFRSSTMEALVTETRVWGMDGVMWLHEGLKTAVRMHTSRNDGVCGPQGAVYVESVDGTPRIVAVEWDDTACGPTDPLRRFGMSTAEDECAIAPTRWLAAPADAPHRHDEREHLRDPWDARRRVLQPGDRDVLAADFTWWDGEHVYGKSEFCANLAPQPDLVMIALREPTATITATLARTDGSSATRQGGRTERVRYMNLLQREGGRWRLRGVRSGRRRTGITQKDEV